MPFLPFLTATNEAVAIYIYIHTHVRCEVIIWSKFGLLIVIVWPKQGYYLVQGHFRPIFIVVSGDFVFFCSQLSANFLKWPFQKKGAMFFSVF